jgi:hypothetical protein
VERSSEATLSWGWFLTQALGCAEGVAVNGVPVTPAFARHGVELLLFLAPRQSGVPGKPGFGLLGWSGRVRRSAQRSEH